MALSITVRLRQSRYDAAATTPADPEWPPHPARLFNALVAAVAPADVQVAVRSGFVVTNATETTTGSAFWPGRTNRASSRSCALPADDRFAFVWPAAEPDDGVMWRLTRLARRVPYLGRSTNRARSSILLIVHPWDQRGEEAACRDDAVVLGR